MGRASIEKAEFWRFVLSEHSQSGLSVREFCRREGVSEPSFYQWRKKLSRKGRDASTRTGQSSSDNSDRAFLPVRVLDGSSCESAAFNQPAGNNDSIEIQTPHGFQLKLPVTVSRDLIREALAAITEVTRREVPSC